MRQFDKVGLAALFLGLAFLCTAPSGAGRLRVVLDTGWHFKQASDITGAEQPEFDDSNWTKVDVPYTWNRVGNSGIERAPETNTIQGAGWYRRTFHAPPAPPDSRFFLQFDGVGTIADVWLNGHYLGKHEGAFARFRFDATAAIHPAGANVLVVKADNSHPQPGATTQDVIPLAGDFFMFGGIYRDVSLIVTSPVHIDMMDFGGPGLYAHAAKISRDRAVVDVRGKLVNDREVPETLHVATEILDGADKPVATAPERVIDLAGAAHISVETTVNIPHPRLWQGERDPYLYRIAMTLRAQDGAVLDRVVQPLGLRTIAFDPDKGFFLNGRHLLLKGVALHQDRPIKGWAISRADQEQDFDILMDMGANAVRLAHYQHDQFSYQLADERGIAVWAEIPVVSEVSFDGSPASPALTANAKQQLTELIRQNYNHPSIVVWSVGNEVDLIPTQKRGPSKAAALISALNDLANREDPSRPTTLADCCEVENVPSGNNNGTPAVPRDVVVGLTDVVGYNRYFGWYYGNAQDFGPFLDRAHRRHPNLPMAVSEYGAGAGLTQHTDDPLGGPINPHGRPHPEELQSYYHEQNWSELKRRPYIWGDFIWNMFDFASNTRQEGDLTDINEKGLVSYDRSVRKDAFYFYRANWSDRPTLHLTGRRYIDRAYSVIDVKAYSNAKEARLQVNGKDIGVARCIEGICLWHSVRLAHGPNFVRATATIGRREVSDAVSWNFNGSPGIVRIKAGDISGYESRDGLRYGSDLYYLGGDARGTNPPDTKPSDLRVVDASDPDLYSSYREGRFSYRIPLPNGPYKVVAHFVEPTETQPGARLFDVRANGLTVLKNFDVFAAAGGKMKGTKDAFEMTVSNGRAILEFLPVKGEALVCALSIEQENVVKDH
ncbi:MAG: beta galactosidase jelly roll domain-containing protein [Alphaproteobacteria bacterium]|nr:beta galactosidase jelly roll domain-containing protein [Alphaproteobacteria bacterium]MDE2111720.1 beta galactosidase jelly roll domain-containing protein [Alphaproteobacteria bacterium]MDE2496173.1 beta galactosidase jelly roll domain-containing protein [Alphaproteobacteria bacterium]